MRRGLERACDPDHRTCRTGTYGRIFHERAYYRCFFAPVQAAEQIRACGREDAQTVPIIALSADAFSEDVQKSLAVGMNSHVAKPVDFSILNREIRKYRLQLSGIPW